MRNWKTYRHNIIDPELTVNTTQLTLPSQTEQVIGELIELQAGITMVPK